MMLLDIMVCVISYLDLLTINNNGNVGKILMYDGFLYSKFYWNIQ
jgi:hypothetical protein